MKNRVGKKNLTIINHSRVISHAVDNIVQLARPE